MAERRNVRTGGRYYQDLDRHSKRVSKCSHLIRRAALFLPLRLTINNRDAGGRVTDCSEAERRTPAETAN